MVIFVHAQRLQASIFSPFLSTKVSWSFKYCNTYTSVTQTLRFPRNLTGRTLCAYILNDWASCSSQELIYRLPVCVWTCSLDRAHAGQVLCHWVMPPGKVSLPLMDLFFSFYLLLSQRALQFHLIDPSLQVQKAYFSLKRFLSTFLIIS